MADRRLSDAERIADWRRLTEAEARDEVLSEGLLGKLRAAQSDPDAAQADWRSMWRVASVEAIDPAAMREWVRDHGDVLEKREMAFAALADDNRIGAKHRELKSALRALLPDEAAESINQITAVGARLLRQSEAARSNYKKARPDVTTAQTRMIRATSRSMPSSRSSRSGGRPGGRSSIKWGYRRAPDDASTALQLWTEIENLARDWRTAADRVWEMNDALQDHDAKIATLSKILGEPVSNNEPIVKLSERKRGAQTTNAEVTRLTGEHAKIGEATHEIAAAKVSATGVLPLQRPPRRRR